MNNADNELHGNGFQWMSAEYINNVEGIASCSTLRHILQYVNAHSNAHSNGAPIAFVAAFWYYAHP